MSDSVALTAPLPWQRSQWRRLQRQLAADQLPHALLLQGSAGLGKAVFARAWAARLLCARPRTEAEGLSLACTTCADCRQLAAGSHPDLRLLQPEAPGRVLRVDEIRQLGEFIGRTSQRGRGKVAVLLAAEQLNDNAANALLKTLEEPPPGSLLILVSAIAERLPATIRSRCQRLLLRPPPPAEALTWLASQVPADVDGDLLLRLVDGAPLRALVQSGTLALRAELFADWQAVLRGQRSVSAIAGDWADEQLGQRIVWLLGWHQDMIRLKMCPPDPVGLRSSDLAASLADLAAVLPTTELFRRLDGLQLLLRDMNLAGTNPALQLMAWLAACAGGRDSG